MKNLLTFFTLLFLLLTTTSYAQWVAMSVKPGAKVYADSKLLKRGTRFSATSKIKFTKKSDYVKVYVKGRAPFTIKPIAGKNASGNELLALAKHLIVPHTVALSTKGEKKKQVIANSRTDFKLLLTGAAPNVAEPLKKARKLLFIGNGGKLYIDKKMYDLSDKQHFMFYYLLAGEKKPKGIPLRHSIDKDQVTISLNRQMYNKHKINTVKKSCICYRKPGQSPQKVAFFRPFFVPTPGPELVKNIKEDVAMLKKYGVNDEQLIFSYIYETFRDFYEATPDINSLKTWISSTLTDAYLSKHVYTTPAKR